MICPGILTVIQFYLFVYEKRRTPFISRMLENINENMSGYLYLNKYVHGHRKLGS